jgi:hypothetical protein
MIVYVLKKNSDPGYIFLFPEPPCEEGDDGEKIDELQVLFRTSRSEGKNYPETLLSRFQPRVPKVLG